MGHESAAERGDISSDEESSDGEGQYCLDLDFTSNDPNLTALDVCFGGSYFDASDVDWEIEGDYIAENTHLISLLMKNLINMRITTRTGRMLKNFTEQSSAIFQ